MDPITAAVTLLDIIIPILPQLQRVLFILALVNISYVIIGNIISGRALLYFDIGSLFKGLIFTITYGLTMFFLGSFYGILLMK
jgi:hypothetical protein